ncbi:hypothetical protein ACFL1H_01220 [Nanoarchaeota archaeon]
MDKTFFFIKYLVFFAGALVAMLMIEDPIVQGLSAIAAVLAFILATVSYFYPE